MQAIFTENFVPDGKKYLEFSLENIFGQYFSCNSLGLLVQMFKPFLYQPLSRYILVRSQNKFQQNSVLEDIKNGIV